MSSMTLTPSTTLTIDQLCLSTLNVRTYSPDAEDTAGLQASILADGLMNPIAVHPMKGSKSKFGAIAGGRRYRAIKALIANGDLPLDYAVRVTILDALTDAELIEHSITENLVRRDLRNFELFAGVARAASRGHGVEQIAKGIGQPNLTMVSRWLRLGRLADPVFDALRTGLISEEQAMALAATEDKDLQRVTFERLAPFTALSPSPAEIRRAMKIGDAKAQRDLAFVGADAYRAAGGRFELDLFADASDERGRVVDEGKLQQLVDEEMERVRAQVRTATRSRTLRFLADKPTDQWGNIDHQLMVTPKRRADGSLELPEGAIAAHIAIDASGAPVVSYWWESRKAKFGSERKPAGTDATLPSTPAAPTSESPFAAHHRAEAEQQDVGVSIDGMFALSAVRRAIIRAALVDDALGEGDVGQDYLVWAQARALLATFDNRPSGLGMRTIAGDSLVGVSHEALALARLHVDGIAATGIVAAAVATITRQRFFTDPNLKTALEAYCAAEPGLKRLTAAVVAGIALDRSLAAPGKTCPVHDAVAHAAGVETDACIRTYWTPTGDMLDLFPKAQRLAIAEPFVDRTTFATWAKLKSSELTTAVLAVVTRAGSAGLSWVHPLFRFGPRDDAGASE